MAGYGMSHRQPKQPSMLRLMELFSASQDMIYGDNHVDRTSETLDGMADHKMLSGSPQRQDSLTPFRSPGSRLKIQYNASFCFLHSFQ